MPRSKNNDQWFFLVKEGNVKEGGRRKTEQEEKEIEDLLDRLDNKEHEYKEILEAEHYWNDREQIKVFAAEIDIPYLVHYTPIENLSLILENGIKSRNNIEYIDYIYTGPNRIDGRLDRISTSISYPNYKTFFQKRSEMIHVMGWAVLQILRDVLWELDCIFFPYNAGTGHVPGTADERWSSIQASKKMPGNTEDSPNHHADKNRSKPGGNY